MTESPFTLRDYKRFGLEIYRTNDYDVEVWDLTALFHPDYGIIPPDLCEFPELKVFKIKNDVLDEAFRTKSYHARNQRYAELHTG